MVLITITGASGTGKTTIIKRIMEKHRRVQPLLSTTTRSPRESDIPNEFEYVTKETFLRMKAEGDFLWTVNVHGNYYGTRWSAVETALLRQAQCIAALAHEAVIELQTFVRRHPPQYQSLFCVYIQTPGQEVLRARLERRESHPDPIDVARRLEDCLSWDDVARRSNVPYIFLQDRNIMEKKVLVVESFFH